jgi:hypothetical protein
MTVGRTLLDFNCSSNPQAKASFPCCIDSADGFANDLSKIQLI